MKKIKIPIVITSLSPLIFVLSCSLNNQNNNQKYKGNAFFFYENDQTILIETPIPKNDVKIE